MKKCDLKPQNDVEFVLSEYQKNSDFVKSPFRYPGGKFYALKHIMPFIECVPHDEFREPFLGGGCIFFAKNKVKFNWINDLESDIIEVYKAFADNETNKKLVTAFEKEVATKERHSEVKKIVPNGKFETAFKTYYLNRTSYSGIIHKPAWGYAIGKSSPPENWIHFIKSAYKKLAGSKITSKDFSEVIKEKAKGKSVLLYLDPPYYNADQKRAYIKSFTKFDHERLCMELKKTNFYFCLSYDDCDEVRNLYSWANIFERKWIYNTANKKGEIRDLGNELVITNYKIKKP